MGPISLVHAPWGPMVDGPVLLAEEEIVDGCICIFFLPPVTIVASHRHGHNSYYIFLVDKDVCDPLLIVCISSMYHSNLLTFCINFVNYGPYMTQTYQTIWVQKPNL